MIDWGRLGPHQFAAYREASMERSEREANLHSLRVLKDLRRTILRDAEITDREPGGIDEIDSMIERVLGRLA